MYTWYRSRSETTGSEPTDGPITERHVAAFLVSRRLDPDDLETVSESVSHAQRTADGAGWVLGIDGATTASLFLDRGREGPETEGEGKLEPEPELVWYVEIPRSTLEEWDDPESTVRDAFPVTCEAVGSPAGVDRELLVHAVNPERPRRVATEETPLEASDPAADRTVDVDLVRMTLESGLPERLADRFAGLSRRVIAGDLTLGPIETWSAEMLDAETMYTESVFLERRADGYSLVGYMEAEEMQRVYDAYYDTWNPVARASEIVLGWVLTDPATILEYPLETDVELLAHAAHPDRPRRVSECGGAALDPDRTTESDLEEG
ncbi:hypothetical protein OB955_05015 [Halobacteria archaeon AArc-m2/3/4]|uniref:Uncharacterized protein n=1 Tax=Natronoglomus mannanivorans TaxID=2979990 RepID=A0ABT2QAZ4_9EURY|nr:hypothetical protein [Halobacteria archaeon AArc-m2/3/4]